MKQRAIQETSTNNLATKVITKQIEKMAVDEETSEKQIIIVKNMFEELKNTSGKKAKEELLTKYVNNKLFFEFIKFLCDDLITTGISKKKMNKEVTGDIEYINLNMYEMLSYIKENNTGKDENVLFIKQFIYSQPEECYDFLIGIFTKSYKCGVTATTLNKIVPGAVIEHCIMLAETYAKFKKKLLGKIFIVTEKLDGQRMTVIKSAKDTLEFFTRKGLPITGLIDIEREFLDERIPIGVYDGELIATGEFSESKDQYKETMKRSRKKGIKTGLKYVCFDYIADVDDFRIRKIDKTPFKTRKERLLHILREQVEGYAEMVDKFEFIDYLDNLYIGTDEEELRSVYESVITFGGEGVMINIADAPYECKRTTNILKYKEFKTADIFAIGVTEGEKNFTGTLGAIIADYKGFNLKVGSGLDMELREQIWNNPDMVIGKIITIQYFEETTNEQGGTSVRFPVFVDIRDDKTEPSYED